MQSDGDMRLISKTFPPVITPAPQVGSVIPHSNFPIAVTPQWLARWAYVAKSWQVSFSVSWSIECDVQEGSSMPQHINETGEMACLLDLGVIYASEVDALKANGAYAATDVLALCGEVTSDRDADPTQTSYVDAQIEFNIFGSAPDDEYNPLSVNEYRWLSSGALWLPSLQFDLIPLRSSGIAYLGYMPRITSRAWSGTVIAPTGEAKIESTTLPVVASSIADNPPPISPDPDATYIFNVDASVTASIVISPSRYHEHDDGVRGPLYDSITGIRVRSLY